MSLPLITKNGGKVVTVSPFVIAMKLLGSVKIKPRIIRAGWGWATAFISLSFWDPVGTYKGLKNLVSWQDRARLGTSAHLIACSSTWDAIVVVTLWKHNVDRTCGSKRWEKLGGNQHLTSGNRRCRASFQSPFAKLIAEVGRDQRGCLV